MAGVLGGLPRFLGADASDPAGGKVFEAKPVSAFDFSFCARAAAEGIGPAGDVLFSEPFGALLRLLRVGRAASANSPVTDLVNVSLLNSRPLLRSLSVDPPAWSATWAVGGA